MASSVDLPWMEDVRTKLVELFAKDHPEDLVRILFYLDEEDKTYKDDSGIPPVWKSLKATMVSDKAFKVYADRLVEDTKKAEKDEGFRKVMAHLWDEMMEFSEEPLPESHAQGFALVRLADRDVSQTSASMGLARAWSQIPAISRAQILELIPKIVTNKQVVSAVDEVVGLVSKTGGAVVMVGLAAIYLGYEAWNNMRRWWKGEISGKRCAKNMIDASFTIGAGAAGGIGGAMLGSAAGPIGTFAGGVIGSVACSSVVNFLIDRLTQTLFGLPKEEAVENAYRYLGVKMTASNHEINTAFRQLCLKCHPDKPGGTKEDFFILQAHMGAIKLARGEF